MFFLAGCASEVTRLPTMVMTASASGPREFVVSRDIQIKLEVAYYSRTIVAGTKFLEIGVSPEGSVLKPINAVLTVEGAHVHEAFLVVKEGFIVGFYLPYEKAFSKMFSPVPFSAKERNS